MIYYTDAGTANNGKKGFQKTIVCIFNELNQKIMEEVIGDYSNNEGELIAIGRALKIKNVTEIRTDSTIARNWVERGWTKKNEKNLRKHKLTERHKKMITKANMLWKECRCKLIWIPRDYNLAGNYLEFEYKL